MILDVVQARACPKCQSPGLACKQLRYPTLGYSDWELACFICGLNLWPRSNESVPQTYFRWLMDRVGA